MAWVRKNSGWLALLFAVATSVAGLWMRAALADTKSRISVLENQAKNDDGRMERIENGVDRVENLLLQHMGRK